MQKTLVLVVHGIGEQSPGETIDALTGGAVQELGLTQPIEGRTEMIAEHVKGSEQLSLFPCTIRKTTIPADPAKNLDQDQELVAAEVYWSDLSPAPKGPLRTGLDLLRSILALGYLALENVENAGDRAGRWSRTGTRLFVHLFYALIAPFNALLFICSLALLTNQFAVPIGNGPGELSGALLMALTALLTLAGCLFWRWSVRDENSSYMVRAFVGGLAGLAAGLAVVSLAAWAMPEAGWLNQMRLHSCRDVAFTACWTRDFEDIAAMAWGGTLLIGAIWLFAVIDLLILFLMMMVSSLGWRRALLFFGLPLALMTITQLTLALSLTQILIISVFAAAAVMIFAPPRRRIMRQVDRATGFFGRRDMIYLSLCNAMLLLWMQITAVLWAGLSTAVQKLDSAQQGRSLLTQIYADYSGILTSMVSYVMFAVAALIIFGAVPLAIRKIKRAELGQQDELTRLDVWCGRLILNPVLNLLLFLLILWIAFGGAFQAAKTVIEISGHGHEVLNPARLIGKFEVFHNRIIGLNVFAISVTALLGVVIYRSADFIAAALGIARDISVYSTRTLAAKPGPGSASRYAQRERILGRFDLVHAHMARQFDYDRLIIIAHSQGTVIAAQSLMMLNLPSRPRFLLTMGSPLTHIYGQYFAADFGLKPLAGKLKRWINIYRCDDFVGTQVLDPSGKVENLRVQPAGHTGYWTDRNVWTALRTALNAPGQQK